jgi:hypothetical protein
VAWSFNAPRRSHTLAHRFARLTASAKKYRQKLAKRHIAADAALEEDGPPRYGRSFFSIVLASQLVTRIDHGVIA